MGVPLASRAAVTAALVAFCCIGILFASLNVSWRAWHDLGSVEPVSAPFWPPTSTLLPAGHSRTVFPYSVIAGGAESPQELKGAAAADPVVAQHYSDFDLAKARRVALDAPKLMYVSYRIGNKVFWTKHKLALRKGEAMLSDGNNMARTRCGNRVSVLPMRPNAPAEPSSSELEAPEFPAIVSSPYLAAYSAPMPAMFSGPGGPGAAFVPVAPFFPLPGGGGIVGNKSSSTPPPGAGGGGNTPPPGGGGTPPPGGGTPPPGGGGTPPPGGGGTPPPGGGGTPPPGGGGTPPPGGGGTPPPVGVPEPGTALLVLVGLGAATMRARRTRKAC
jgi:hypothetical protein